MFQKIGFFRAPFARLRTIRAATGIACAPIVLLLFLSGGCQTLDRNELTWQTLHAVDVAQTLNAASNPCYMEKAWLTRRIIGEQPSDASVALWGIGTAIAHKFVSDLMERRDVPGWMQKTWDLGTISHTGYAIVSNHNNGVRVWDDNESYAGCNR